MPRPNRAIIPIECKACHKIIGIGDVLVNHHISYFPEVIIQVHRSCHSRIHVGKTMYQELRPDPRQVLRWYKKLNSNHVYHTYASEYVIQRFFNRLWYTVMTPEQRKEYDNDCVKRYWDEVSEQCQQKAKGVFERV